MIGSGHILSACEIGWGHLKLVQGVLSAEKKVIALAPASRSILEAINQVGQLALIVRASEKLLV